MFSLPHLRSKAIKRSEPWKFRGVPPEKVFKDKKARDTWINCIKTQWDVYSLVEGLNDNKRISESRNEEDANPPHKLHGFVADYDSPIPDEKLLEALEKFPFVPSHVERTLSGNLRLIWLFEEPMTVPSSKYLRYFLKHALEYFQAHKLLPGFDEGAWCEPGRYYTNSGQWMELENAKPIPADRIRGWAIQIGSKFNWVKEDGGAEIPMEDLRKELRAKYPRFSEWPGEFSLGEQGPSFWIEDSTSPKSAIVRPTGMQTFSAHALKGFYTWGDVLGKAFVKDYQADNLGRGVEGIYHDGKQYYRQLGRGIWRAFDKHDTKDFLRVARRISPKIDKETLASDVDRAMQYIMENQAVDGCGKFVYRPTGIVKIKDSCFLNTSTVKVLQPSGNPNARLGPGGGFEFLSEYLLNLYLRAEGKKIVYPEEIMDNPEEQCPYFWVWLSVFWRSGYFQKPQSGQNLFIAGPPGVGKTLLNEIISRLAGGSAQAQDYLLGKDTFGGEMFGAPHWMVDDAVFTTNYRSIRVFSEMIKKMAANTTHKFHEKFRMPCEVEWLGRIVATLNEDPESIRGIPELSGTILDKIMLFRTATKPPVKFPPRHELNQIINKELPELAQALLNTEVPEWMRGESRFVIKSYHEPSLVMHSERSSYSAGFLEILEDWKEFYFEHEKDATYWEGSAFQLHKAIHADETTTQAMRSYDVNAVSRQLAHLANKGHRIENLEHTGSTHRWRIYKDDHTQAEKYEAATNSESE